MLNDVKQTNNVTPEEVINFYHEFNTKWIREDNVEELRNISRLIINKFKETHPRENIYVSNTELLKRLDPNFLNIIYSKLKDLKNKSIDEMQNRNELKGHIKKLVYEMLGGGESTNSITSIQRERIIKAILRRTNEYSSETLMQLPADKLFQIWKEVIQSIQEDGNVTSNTGMEYSTPKAFKKDKCECLKESINKVIEKELLKEGTYSQFKKDIKFRTKSEQLAKAVKEVNMKLNEINRLVEYTSRMKQELSEGEEGLKYWKHTEKAVGQISETITQLSNKIKSLNQ